ncbi:hypothetical protein RYX36_027319 [Vicia faba]
MVLPPSRCSQSSSPSSGSDEINSVSASTLFGSQTPSEFLPCLAIASGGLWHGYVRYELCRIGAGQYCRF